MSEEQSEKQPDRVRIIQDNPDADRELVEEARKFERELKVKDEGGV